MDDKLFNWLIKIGIDQTTAHNVAVSLNPDHIATKADILRLEKLILDVQEKIGEQQVKVNEQLNKQQIETTEKLAAMQTKSSEQFMMHNRQFTITFLGMILTACVLFAMNLYFH